MTIEATDAAGTATQTNSADRVAFVVNGTPVTVRRDHPHLLAALREEMVVALFQLGVSGVQALGPHNLAHPPVFHR